MYTVYWALVFFSVVIIAILQEWRSTGENTYSWYDYMSDTQRTIGLRANGNLSNYIIGYMLLTRYAIICRMLTALRHPQQKALVLGPHKETDWGEGFSYPNPLYDEHFQSDRFHVVSRHRAFVV